MIAYLKRSLHRLKSPTRITHSKRKKWLKVKQDQLVVFSKVTWPWIIIACYTAKPAAVRETFSNIFKKFRDPYQLLKCFLSNKLCNYWFVSYTSSLGFNKFLKFRIFMFPHSLQDLSQEWRFLEVNCWQHVAGKKKTTQNGKCAKELNITCIYIVSSEKKSVHNNLIHIK